MPPISVPKRVKEALGFPNKVLVRRPWLYGVNFMPSLVFFLHTRIALQICTIKKTPEGQGLLNSISSNCISLHLLISHDLCNLIFVQVISCQIVQNKLALVNL